MLPSSSPVVVIVPQARLHVAFWMIQALEPSLERAGVEIHQQASRAARDHLFSNPIPSSWCSAMISKGARSAPREPSTFLARMAGRAAESAIGRADGCLRNFDRPTFRDD
jgi:hypothetical protein